MRQYFCLWILEELLRGRARLFGPLRAARAHLSFEKKNYDGGVIFFSTCRSYKTVFDNSLFSICSQISSISTVWLVSSHHNIQPVRRVTTFRIHEQTVLQKHRTVFFHIFFYIRIKVLFKMLFIKTTNFFNALE